MVKVSSLFSKRCFDAQQSGQTRLSASTLKELQLQLHFAAKLLRIPGITITVIVLPSFCASETGCLSDTLIILRMSA